MAVSREGIVRENLRRINKQYYSTRDREVAIYEIPEMNFIYAEGTGEHDIYRMYDFKEIWTMGRFINRVKHYTKKEITRNFSRMPLEMEWGELQESGIRFKALMAVPVYIDETAFTNAIADLQMRLGEFEFKIHLKTIVQGPCAQILHQGRYRDIGIALEKLNEEMYRKGYQARHSHREIYMNHPHCNPPEKLQILIRQPIEV